MQNKVNDKPYGGLDANKIHSAEPILNLENFKLLYELITERYRIHLKKDVNMEQAPWTDNPCLRYYRFTNVRREHDKTTMYLIEKLEEHKDEPFVNILLNIILFRLFNKIETYELLGGWLDFENLNVGKVKAQLNSAPPEYVFFTNAFYTSGTKVGLKSYGNPNMSLPVTTVYAVWANRMTIAFGLTDMKAPEDFIEAVKQVRGIGNFLAYQIFVDCTYLPEEVFPWSENEFVMAGPGCVRGLKQIYAHWDGLTAEELLFHLRDTIDENFRLLVDPEWDVKKLMTDLPMYDRRLNVMSLENCMCEISKYIKAITNKGRPRNLYYGGV